MQNLQDIHFLYVKITLLAKHLKIDHRTLTKLLERVEYPVENGYVDLTNLLSKTFQDISSNVDGRKKSNKNKDDQADDGLNLELDDYRLYGPVHRNNPLQYKLFLEGADKDRALKQSLGQLIDIQDIKMFLAEYIGRLKGEFDSVVYNTASYCEKNNLPFTLVDYAKDVRANFYRVSKETLIKLNTQFNTQDENSIYLEGLSDGIKSEQDVDEKVKSIIDE